MITLRIVLLGSEQSGKSSIIDKFMGKDIKEDYQVICH
jgi:GTPase SAR1 family protein